MLHCYETAYMGASGSSILIEVTILHQLSTYMSIISYLGGTKIHDYFHFFISFLALTTANSLSPNSFEFTNVHSFLKGFPGCM